MMKFSSRLLIVCTLVEWRGVAADISANASSTQVDTGKSVHIYTEPPLLMLKTHPLLSLREQNLSTEWKISSQVLLMFLNLVSIYNKLGTGIASKIVKNVKFQNNPLKSISDAVGENVYPNEKVRNTISKIPDLTGKRHHTNKISSEKNINIHNILFFATSNGLISPMFDPTIQLNEINDESRKNWPENLKKDTVIWEKDKVNLSSNTSFNNLPETHENAKSEQKFLDYDNYSHNVEVRSARNTRSVDNDVYFIDNQYRSMNVTAHDKKRKPRRRSRNKRQWLEIHNEGLESYESNTLSQPISNSTQSRNNVAKKPMNDFRGSPKRNRGRRRRYKHNKNERRIHDSGDSTVLENHTFNQPSSNTAGSYNPHIQNFKNDISRENKLQNHHNTGTNGPNMNNTYDNGTIHQYSDHNDRYTSNSDLDTILNNKGSSVNNDYTDHPHNHNTSVGVPRRITRRRRGRRLKEDLSLYIDQDQVQRLSGYPMEIYVIQDGRVLPYVLDPNFNNRLPVIPPEVSSFNFTWSGGGRRRYRYQVDNLASLNPDIMEHPTLSIPPRGRIPRRHTGFEIKLPCYDNATGTTTFTVRLKIRTRHQHLAGTPIRVRLRKRCHPIDPHGGAAQCPVGLMGPNCTEALCFPHCLHGGVCRAPGRCVCPAGYHGRYCEGGICSDRCLNGGKCVQKDRCACARGYYGKTCQFSKCVVPCVNGGVCRGDNKCRCKPGFGGSHCEVTQQTSAVRLQRCRERCVHGHCHDVTGVCRCDDAHSGRWCRRRARGRRRRIWV